MAAGVHRRARIMRVVWSIVDAMVWIFAIFATSFIRLDFSFGGFSEELTVFAVVAAVAHVALGYLFGPYAIGHVRGSFDEIIDLSVTVTVVALGVFTWSIALDEVFVPRGRVSRPPRRL